MNTFFNWLITSSANPKALSLTVRGFLVGLLPLFIMLTGATTEYAESLIDGIVNLVFFITSAGSTLAVVIGLFRKIKIGKWSAYVGK